MSIELLATIPQKVNPHDCTGYSATLKSGNGLVVLEFDAAAESSAEQIES